MYSIRNFLVTVLLAVITLSTFAAALHGYQDGLSKTDELFDRQLLDLAHVVAAIELHQDLGELTRNKHKALQVWTITDTDTDQMNTTLSFRSGNTPDTAISAFSPGFSFANFSGHRWRVVSYYDPKQYRWVMVGEPVDVRHALAERIILDSVLPTVMMIPLLGLTIWLVVGRGLAPVRRLANQLATKQSHDLTQLDTDNQPLELHTLSTSINSLLNRLADAFERERRFAGDAAHELRTPISVLKVHLHNMSNTLPPDTPGLAELHEGVERMGHLVEQILALYRMSPDQFHRRFTSVDLFSLAQGVISDLYSRIADKQHSIELCGDSIQIQGDAPALKTLLSNLLINAIKYTPTGGQIRVTVEADTNGSHLIIDDSGPGIVPELYGRVFQRFYRVGGDQHQSQESGCGLGLAIVKHIADIHHANIQLGKSCFTSGLKVDVFFPHTTLPSEARTT